MTFRIILEGQPEQTVCRQVADLVGEEQMMFRRGHLEIVLPDQSAVARVVSQLTALGCRISEVDSDRA